MSQKVSEIYNEEPITVADATNISFIVEILDYDLSRSWIMELNILE